MGVVIFLLICLVVVLIGFLIKYKNENSTENINSQGEIVNILSYTGLITML